MVSSTPGGSGLPIGLMPGALPSDQASRQTLSTTAMRFFFGHSHFGLFMWRFHSRSLGQPPRKLAQLGRLWIGARPLARRDPDQLRELLVGQRGGEELELDRVLDALRGHAAPRDVSVAR